MAELEPVPGETPKTPPADKTPAGTQAPDTAGMEAELVKVRAALHSANKEAADRRKKLEAFEKADEERKLAAMTELEKVQAELKASEDAREAIERDARQALISHAVHLEAATANFHKPEDAMAFLGVAEFDVDDEGKVQGVAEALKALAKERPYLVKPATTGDPDARKRSAPQDKIEVSKQAEINTRYGIRDLHVK